MTLAGRQGRGANVTYLLTGHMQIFNDLAERNNLIPEEVGGFRARTSRSGLPKWGHP